MHCVVAMLHEHSEEFAELHGKSYASTWTQTIHVFAAFFPRRHIGCAAIAGKNLAFFKVDVDWVVPSCTGVLERPDFTRARCRGSGNPSIVSLEHGSTISLNAPGIFIRRISEVFCAAAELKRAFANHRDVREIGVGNHLCRNLAQIGLGRVCGDAEFQNLTNARIGRFTSQRVCYRAVCRRFLAILMFTNVHQPDFIPKVVAREVNDPIVALGDALLVGHNLRHRLREEVAVIRDLNHRRTVRETVLEEA